MYNYVDLAHAISYVSVADDVVKCNHSDDRLFCLIQKCGFFFFIQSDYIQILTYTLWDHWAFCPFAPAVSDMCCHIKPRPGVEPGYKVLVSDN